MVRFIPLVAVGLIAVPFAVRRYYATASGRLRIDRTLLKLPLLGKILTNLEKLEELADKTTITLDTQ